MVPKEPQAPFNGHINQMAKSDLRGGEQWTIRVKPVLSEGGEGFSMEGSFQRRGLRGWVQTQNGTQENDINSNLGLPALYSCGVEDLSMPYIVGECGGDGWCCCKDFFIYSYLF